VTCLVIDRGGGLTSVTGRYLALRVASSLLATSHTVAELTQDLGSYSNAYVCYKHPKVNLPTGTSGCAFQGAY
jgi:hypothetical protein